MQSKMNGNKANILGVNFNGSWLAELLNTIVELATSQDGRRKPVIVFTPNPEFLVEAQKDAGFKTLLNKADINLPDGVGLVLAGKVLNQNIRERVSGADVVRELLEVLSKSKSVVGIAGARGGVQNEAEELVKRLEKKHKNINFINLDSKFEILNSKFNVVLACHGMKKQEKWIWENKDQIRANVFMGVGGSLDFLTGFSRRAPVFMRQVGLEWLWRGLQRPKHFKRIWKATVVFGWLVIKVNL